jgi:uncharacterized protein
MSKLSFTWDTNKAKSNKNKHGIDFDEAKSVFYDDNALLISDPDHIHDEERFILLGMSNQLNILIVCHCYRENDSIIRIISARKSTKHEKKQYLEVLSWEKNMIFQNQKKTHIAKN